jgi:ligand-binding sensor domain-containing protein/two-component sensor histidine kinase
VRHFRLWLAAVLLAPSLLQARRLPIKTYTTADGLARDVVLCIVQDSHGFMWFCTAEGLSRFDGYQFTNYRTEQGLPSNGVTGFLETRKGVYWIATTAGVARFDPAGTGASRFHRYPLSGDREEPKPYVLYGDPEGAIWCGTRPSVFPPRGAGLFRLGPKDAAFRRVDLGITDSTVTALFVDRRGTLWVGSPNGLYRREPDGTIRTYTTADGLPHPFIMALLEDRDGRLWVGTRFGLARIDAERLLGQPLRTRVYTVKDGLPALRIESLFQSSDGKLWVGTDEGLAEWIPAQSPGGSEFQSYTVSQGLSARRVGALAEDRDGNLWLGTDGGGAMKVARGGFTTYTQVDGVPEASALMESRQGELCALYKREGGLVTARFDGRRFVPIQPGWPKQINYYGWGTGQIAVQDQSGEWWIATGQGLCRFARVDRVDQLGQARPKAVYTSRDGLLSDNIFRVFEDSRSDIWIGTIGPGLEDSLARWERRTGRVHAFSQADGLPAKPAPTAFAEDRAGNVWVSLYHEALARFRDGRFTVFTTSDAVPGFLNRLFVDSAGRLWIGTSRGLVRVDDPTQDPPRFVTYNTTQGLSSDYIAGITEDRWGRVYVETGRGIDRFEPQAAGPGRIKHYTTADGVAAGELELAFRDRQGALWFSTSLGVSQFMPAQDRPRVPPPVLVTGLSIAGVPHPISDLGESAISGLRLYQNSLRIDFVGLGFSPGESLRYQYKLDGADSDWTAPSDQRAVVYASLSAGSYRFLVRAVASDGAVSPQPASVAFTILPPVWRTWWFILSCALVVSLILYALYRYRLAQLLAVANVRTRIATDLHDDIGASLSQIAILSEVAKRGVDGTESPIRKPLTDIAGISRELLDSMSDIVWAINPEHDRLSNLVYRMRRFATDVLGGQKIGLQFRSSVTDHNLRVGVNVRRQVYLIFKEAINNIARHSCAGQVEVDLDRADDTLVLRVHDDGKGFDPAVEYEGHGLVNMRKRAATLDGKVELQSAAGVGATLRVTVRVESGRTLLTQRTGRRQT